MHGSAPKGEGLYAQENLSGATSQSSPLTIVGIDLLLDFSYHPTLGPAVCFLFLERNFKQSKVSVSTLILPKDDSTSLCEAVSLLNSGAE